MRFFSADHEWIETDGDTALVGITDFAQSQLGDIVFVELPAAGKKLVKGETAAIVESVKIASDIFAPITGEIVAVNEMVAADPSLLNSQAEQNGWLFKLTISDPSQLNELMDQQSYSDSIA